MRKLSRVNVVACHYDPPVRIERAAEPPFSLLSPALDSSSLSFAPNRGKISFPAGFFVWGFSTYLLPEVFSGGRERMDAFQRDGLGIHFSGFDRDSVSGNLWAPFVEGLSFC